MKVGLVTLYRGYNYGTSLQAYALKRFISSLGWRTELLWLAEGAGKGRDIRLAKIAKIVWRCLWHPQLLRHTFLSYKNSFSKPLPSEIREKFLTFAHTKLQVKGLPAAQLKKFAQDDDTLALVCGSDQIWSAAAANIDPLYFLRFAPEHKRVAYAPSFGGKTVPEYNRKILASYIREIPFVSVREDSGADIVKNLTDKDAPVLPDPSLLLDWEEFAGPAPFDNYIAAYFLDTPSQAALQSLQRISAKHGCQIIAFPYRHAAYERLPRITYYPAGPQDFVRLIKGAKCVLTDSFHGTVFSINLQTPFWTFQRNYASGKGQSERLLSLLGKINLQSRYITSPDIKTQDIPSDAQTQTAAKEWVISQRNAARDFLQNAFRRIGEKNVQ